MPHEAYLSVQGVARAPMLGATHERAGAGTVLRMERGRCAVPHDAYLSVQGVARGPILRCIVGALGATYERAGAGTVLRERGQVCRAA